MITNIIQLWLAGRGKGNNILHKSEDEKLERESRRKQLIPHGTQIANTNTCEHFKVLESFCGQY
jgi:hypothetical protein